jgi:H+/Cl- antiporter ClcA
MYWVIFGIVMFAGVAMMVREGLWSNTIMLVNIIISGLVAFGFYSPLVIYLDEKTDGEHTYWLDFAVIWALYCATFVVMRTLTAAASKTRMRFKNPIDPIAGPAMGFLAAWVLAGFTLATLHTSPMPKSAFSGKLVYGNKAEVESASMFTQPDIAWLNFVERMSAPDAAYLPSGAGAFGAWGFVDIYQKRREKFEKAPGLVVDRS